jgi:hypothetical protein
MKSIKNCISPYISPSPSGHLKDMFLAKCFSSNSLNWKKHTVNPHMLYAKSEEVTNNGMKLTSERL